MKVAVSDEEAQLGAGAEQQQRSGLNVAALDWQEAIRSSDAKVGWGLAFQDSSLHQVHAGGLGCGYMGTRLHSISTD